MRPTPTPHPPAIWPQMLANGVMPVWHWWVIWESGPPVFATCFAFWRCSCLILRHCHFCFIVDCYWTQPSRPRCIWQFPAQDGQFLQDSPLMLHSQMPHLEPPGALFDVIEVFSVENMALLQHFRCSHCNSFTGAFYNLHMALFPITNASKMMDALSLWLKCQVWSHYCPDLVGCTVWAPLKAGDLLVSLGGKDREEFPSEKHGKLDTYLWFNYSNFKLMIKDIMFHYKRRAGSCCLMLCNTFEISFILVAD